MSTDKLKNRFRLIRSLGEGAMGKVWLAEDYGSGRSLALKVISRQFGANDKHMLQFQQEFRLMTKLRHPNCCEVFDYGQLPDGEPYFTMEVVPGQGLDDLVPVAPDAFVGLFSQVLLALGHVHQQGLVHRDLKSANVRVRPDGVVKLMDFGLMEYAGQAGAPISGTLPYIAPEVLKRGPIDQRTDLYALGVLAYELLTGTLPFAGDSPIEVIRAHMNQAPEAPSRRCPGLPLALERVVLKLLAKEPIERFQSAGEVLEALGVEAPAGLGGNLLSSPLVGREHELDSLSELIKRVASRQGGASVALYGLAGVGKSRLAQELRFAAQLENLPCVLGRQTEQASQPYGPFVPALRSLLPVLQESVPDTLARLAPVLVKLISELDVPPAPDMDHPGKEKVRLQAAICELLLDLARARGVVAILEDWQWADALSLELLETLLRMAGDAPLMVVLTARLLEADAAKWPAGVQPLRLAALDAHGLRRMLGSMLGSDHVDAGFLARVASLSGGNPFYVERLLDHLVKHGVLIKQQGRWNLDCLIPDDQALENLQGMLSERLEQLSPQAVALVRAAAVIARTVGLDLLKAVTGFDDETLLGAVEELESNLVLLRGDDGEYRFQHEQMEALVYDAMVPAERLALHGLLARRLAETVEAVGLAAVGLELVTSVANHALRSSTPALAIPYALESGRRHAALYAYLEAERLLRAGLTLVEAEGAEARPREKLAYAIELADVLRFTGQVEAARDAYRAAVVLAERLEAHAMAGRMLTSLAKTLQELNELDGAVECCDRALLAAECAQDISGSARTLETRSRAHFFRGDIAAALADVEQAVDQARTAGAAPIIASAEAFLGYLNVTHRPDRLAEGIAQLRDASDRLEAMGDRMGLNNACSLLGGAFLRIGDFQAARLLFQQSRAICHEIGYTIEQGFAVLNLGLVAYELGEFQECVALAKEALAGAELRQQRYQQGLAHLLMAAGGVVLGEFGSSVQQIEQAIEIAQAMRHRYLETLARQYQVEILLYLGQLDQALVAGLALRELMAETRNTEPEVPLALALAVIHARKGDRASAEIAAGQALDAARAAQTDGLLLRALKVKAWLLTQADDFAAARSMAEEGCALASRIGAKFHQAELQGLLGHLALATGVGDALGHFRTMEDLACASDSRLHQALAMFGRAAARPYAAEAKDLSQDAGAMLGSLGLAAGEAGLTGFLAGKERERVVAGNFIAYSLPSVAMAERAQPTQGPRGLGFGSMM